MHEAQGHWTGHRLPLLSGCILDLYRSSRQRLIVPRSPPWHRRLRKARAREDRRPPRILGSPTGLREFPRCGYLHLCCSSPLLCRLLLGRSPLAKDAITGLNCLLGSRGAFGRSPSPSCAGSLAGHWTSACWGRTNTRSRGKVFQGAPCRMSQDQQT